MKCIKYHIVLVDEKIDGEVVENTQHNERDTFRILMGSYHSCKKLQPLSETNNKLKLHKIIINNIPDEFGPLLRNCYSYDR